MLQSNQQLQCISDEFFVQRSVEHRTRHICFPNLSPWWLSFHRKHHPSISTNCIYLMLVFNDSGHPLGGCTHKNSVTQGHPPHRYWKQAWSTSCIMFLDTFFFFFCVLYLAPGHESVCDMWKNRLEHCGDAWLGFLTRDLASWPVTWLPDHDFLIQSIFVLPVPSKFCFTFKARFR